MKVYIGIDPGFTTTGVVGLMGDVILGAAAFAADKDGSLEVRACRLARRAFYYAYGLTHAATEIVLCIEENIAASHGNAATTHMQRELIGALTFLAVEHDWTVARVYPVTAKKALTGSGKADKDAVVAAARARFGIPSPAMPKGKAEAIADAIAAAVAVQQGDDHGTTQEEGWPRGGAQV